MLRGFREVGGELQGGFPSAEVSVTNAEGPPVPIPNTEVKLCSADDTRLETARENRSMLTHRTAVGSARKGEAGVRPESAGRRE